MNNLKAVIRNDPNGGFVGYVIRIDYDGNESVITKINHYSSKEIATKKIDKTIKSIDAK